MINTFNKILLLTFISCGVVSCGRTEPIYNVDQQYFPESAKELSEAEIKKAILKATSRLGWVCYAQEPGNLNCQVQRRGHEAKVTIHYDQNIFSIHHVSTSNMKAKENRVHRKYNKWIKALEREIRTEILKTAYDK